MKVHRALIRFDYKLNHDIMDKPGQVIKALHTAFGDGCWTELGESTADHRVRALLEDRPESAPWLIRENFKVLIDPTTVIFDSEFLNPPHISKIFENNFFSKVINWFSDLFKEYEIVDIERAGLRLYAFDKLKDFSSVNKVYCEKFIDKELFSDFYNELGRISDLGLKFESKLSDTSGINYNSGPCNFMQGEYSRYFNVIKSSFDLIKSSENDCEVYEKDFVVDGDIYERTFRIASSPRRWISMNVEVLERAMEANKKAIMEAL